MGIQPDKFSGYVPAVINAWVLKSLHVLYIIKTIGMFTSKLAQHLVHSRLLYQLKIATKYLC
jgi:hypothetical protein